MKKLFKSMLCMLLIASLVLSLAACGADKGIKKWVDENKSELTQMFDDGETEVKVEVKGKKIVMTIESPEMDNATDEEIKEAETGMAMLEGIMQASLQQAKETEEDLKNLEGLDMKFCNSKGKKVLELNVELD